MSWSKFLVFLLVTVTFVNCQLEPDVAADSPVCSTCRDGVLALKNAIPPVATFARTVIGTIIDKVCNHILPEVDILEAFCHVIDNNVEERIYNFLMFLYEKIDEKRFCHAMTFCL